MRIKALHGDGSDAAGCIAAMQPAASLEFHHQLP
jgi:hypothetical protein